MLVSDAGSVETSYLDESAAVEGELFVYRVVALAGGVAGARSGPARVRYAAPEPEPEPVVRTVEPEPVTDPVPEPGSGAGGVVWSASVSVGAHEGSFPQLSGYSRWARVGSLSVDRFAVEGASYRVLVLVDHAEGLYLGVDRALPSDFVLTVER